MFRTADGAGVEMIALSGYTPRPHRFTKRGGQARPVGRYLTRAEKEIGKTALGAEASVAWKRFCTAAEAIGFFRKEGFGIAALEQRDGSIPCDAYRPKGPVALIVGNEVLGIDRRILDAADAVLEIPMHGKKNSLNVSVAAGIALYRIRGTMDTVRK